MWSISSTFTGIARIFRHSTWRIRRSPSAPRACCSTRCSIPDAAKRRRDPMQILLANPRGFCAGVDRAIDIVERAIDQLGAPIYVRHEVVHNKYVEDRLRTIGAVFVEVHNEVPDGAAVVFRANRVSRAIQMEATHRSLKVFDGTCP